MHLDCQKKLNTSTSRINFSNHKENSQSLPKKRNKNFENFTEK